jgi:hypothetical protein
MRQKFENQKNPRPPRIRVPNHERALFLIENQKFVGIINRLSLSGGSVNLAKGPIAQGTIAEMGLNTVFGRVRAQIEFLHTGADGIPLAQAFRFVNMDDVSRDRFRAAAEQMQAAGFSDVEQEPKATDAALASLIKLRDNIRRLSVAMTSGRRIKAKK